eukprot:CAMPEP_0185160256 /NCGR_PEP_ID=MMETSP1139-20130426/3538_1 /TAXON_ID=298111 /ORGANISM="Pavlova sp., Strain CCMP459" /LENGTH=144 /DNA_ID=CAMNT_0027725457 /DNA_START=57 /DNA_END=488 /DNA_ORIENTATION=+
MSGQHAWQPVGPGHVGRRGQGGRSSRMLEGVKVTARVPEATHAHASTPPSTQGALLAQSPSAKGALERAYRPPRAHASERHRIPELRARPAKLACDALCLCVGPPDSSLVLICSPSPLRQRFQHSARPRLAQRGEESKRLARTG